MSLSIGLLCSYGCATLPPSRAAAWTPAPLPPEVAAYYDYPDHHPQATRRLVSARRAFQEWWVQFPLSASGFEPTEPTVEFEWFESSAAGRRPAIVFNAILGGDYPLERGVCRFLAGHGMHVALIHRRTLKIPVERDVEYLELLLRQGVVRIRQVVDWMSEQERVDPQRLGSFGISMGGIAGVLTAAVEPRLRAQVVVLAGGGIGEILTTSTDRLLSKPLNRYLARRHMDRQMLARRLREEVKTDPILLAPYVDREKLLMVIAMTDRTIGRANALRLYRALGRPRAVFLPTGHYTSYFFLPYIERLGLRFLRKRLGA